MPWAPEPLPSPFSRTPRVRDRQSNRFYASPRWRRFRKLLLSQRPLCEECAKRGFVSAANEVHHLIPLRDGGPELDPANCLCTCKPRRPWPKRWPRPKISPDRRAMPRRKGNSILVRSFSRSVICIRSARPSWRKSKFTISRSLNMRCWRYRRARRRRVCCRC